jgi:hypothetical protein
MILVKCDRTNQKKSKPKKYSLVTDFDPEDILLVDDENIPANSLYKMCDENIEELNKRLERCRLIQRAIECSFDRNRSSYIQTNTERKTINRRKGNFVATIDDQNGILIH